MTVLEPSAPRSYYPWESGQSPCLDSTGGEGNHTPGATAAAALRPGLYPPGCKTNDKVRRSDGVSVSD
ncbi:hypothetical protein GN956_G11682 [Arapaima gigas]